MYRNKTKSRSRRSEIMQNIAMVAFICACFALMIGVPVYNMQSETDQMSWYVSGGNVQIAAAPVTAVRMAEEETVVPTEEPVWVDLSRRNVQQKAAPAQKAEPQTPYAVVPAPADTESVVPAETEQPVEAVQPAESPVNTITITAVGDCTLGGNVPSGGDGRFDKYVEQYGYDYFFENVRHIFENDDLTIVNLEGPLTKSSAMRENRTFNFRGKTSYVNILSGSSVEICNVANNHSKDFGSKGLTETAEVLGNAGVGCSGYDRIYTTTVKGVKVCSLGFTQWDYSANEIKKACQKAKKNCDLLIVSVHWGEEKNFKATSLQKELGRAAIDGGADVVLGHHSHVIGGVDKYKGKYIVYSLGNFCFGGNGNPDDQRTLIFQQTFEIAEDGSIADSGINIIPAAISSTTSKNNFQPMILSGEKGEAVLKKIAQYSGLSMNDTKWMEDSYMVKLGYVNADDDLEIGTLDDSDTVQAAV